MIVDNFNTILPLMEFKKPDDFYIVQIIQRKKDGNDDLGKGNNGARTVKCFNFYSAEHLSKTKERIIKLCERNNARAYMYLTSRNATEVCLKTAIYLNEMVVGGTPNIGAKAWDRISALNPCGEKSWLIDVDTTNADEIHEIGNIILGCQGYPRIKAAIPTLNGVHLYTSRFNKIQFKERIGNLPATLCENSPTLLYYNSERKF